MIIEPIEWKCLLEYKGDRTDILPTVPGKYLTGICRLRPVSGLVFGIQMTNGTIFKTSVVKSHKHITPMQIVIKTSNSEYLLRIMLKLEELPENNL